MLFNDLKFIYFLIPVLLAFYPLNISKRADVKNLFLLIASYTFYGIFEPKFLWILLYITLINYIGIRILMKRSKNNFVITNIVILSLLPLLFYKYTYFLLNDVLGIEGEMLGKIALPVGI